MTRTRFSNKTKLEAYERANGCCEVCGLSLAGKRPEYDHVIACAFGGNAELANCRVLCRTCHDNKTRTTDIPNIAKSRRIRLRQAGIIKPRTILVGRRFDGTPIRYTKER